MLGELARIGPDRLKDSLPHIEAVLDAFFAERHSRTRDPVLHNAEWAAGTHHHTDDALITFRLNDTTN